MDMENPIITLRVIEEIYNKDASLFIHQKKIIIYLVRMVEPHEFQDDYILGSWKYSTSIVHELRLRIMLYSNGLMCSGPYQHPIKASSFLA